MSEDWTSGEISVLLKYGPSMLDEDLSESLLPRRTASSIKHKRLRIGLHKRPLYPDRISATEEEKIPGVIDLALAHTPTVDEILTSGLTPEQERAQTLMLFLSRLDEYSPETLAMIEDALEVAKRGWVLLHGE